MTAEDELRDLVAERAAAVHAKDLDTLVGRVAPDVTVFTMLPPSLLRGAAAEEELTRTWFGSYATDIGYEVRDLQVHAAGDVGFVAYRYKVSGTMTSGDEVAMWCRATLGCLRVDGRWTIVHDHESVPFDPATGQAVISAEP